MKNIICYSVALILISPCISWGRPSMIAPSGMTEFNKTCPAKELCPKIEAAFQQCKINLDAGHCREFVDLFSQLTPVYDCHRSFDQRYIVPGIWVCGESKRSSGEPYNHMYFQLVSELEFPFAREYFGSEAFRNVLDGEYKTMYYEKSIKAGKD